MTDANLAFSYDIGVSLIENADGTVCLEYAPSVDWTSSSDRAYPIIIDPAIMVDNKDVSWAEDVCVIDDSTNDTDQNRNFYNDYVGMVANTTVIEDGEEKAFDSEIYTKINVDWFKNFGKDIVITEAQYLFAGASMNGCALAKKIAEPVDLTTVTYTTKPELEAEVFDYYTSPYVEGDKTEMVYAHFNITEPLNGWLNGKDNNGFAIIAGDSDFYSLFYMNGIYSYTNPTTNVTTTKKYSTTMCFDFVDLGGYNENLNYHSQSAGRAGTGYVNDYTQSLSVIREDLSVAGNIMPVTVGMIYNSAITNMINNIGYDGLLVYGNNWTNNYLRTFVTISEGSMTYYTENGASIDYDYSINENGELVFTETNTDLYGESGYTVELVAATETEEEHVVITRPDGYVEQFNSDGLLISISNPDYPEQKISITYEYPNNIGRPDYITDGAGRKYDYIYNDSENLLTKIKCYSADGTEILAGTTNSPLEVSYTYDENRNLTGVTYPDGKTVTYTYDESGNMTAMENIDGYRVVYTYDSNGRVTKVTEQAYNGTTYVDGNYITYERLSAAQIKLSDALGNSEIYQFGSKGNLLYTIDSNGNYVMSGNSGSDEETYFISSSDYRVNSENLLTNPSFEQKNVFETGAKGWTVVSSPFERTSVEDAYFGDYVLKTVNDNEGVAEQIVPVLSGGDYTLSAYVKSNAESGQKLNLTIYSLDGSGEVGEEATTSVETTGGEWQRYTAAITAPEGTEEIVIELSNENGGTFLIDNVQLEQSPSESSYNYLADGGFRNDLDYWTTSDDFTIVESTINGEKNNAVSLSGGVYAENTLHQTVTINGKKDDVFTIGGWLKGEFVNSSTDNAYILDRIEKSSNPKLFNFTKDRYAQLEVSYQYTEEKEDGTTETLTETIAVPFAENLEDWQFAAQDFALKGDCEEVTVLIRYSKHTQTALISNIELSKDEDAVVISDEEEEATEETKNCPCENCEEADCTCTCESEALCGCISCKRRSDISEKDSFGNITSSSSFDGVKTIRTLSEYTPDGNYLLSETDADGNTVTYDYNTPNGILDAVIDANGNKTSYTYDAYGLLTSVSDDNSLTSSANYVYNNDRLVAISHNGFTYNLTYDEWGQLTSVSVGDTLIISYTYGVNQYRDRILETTYCNTGNTEGTTFKYQYKDGNISKVRVNGVVRYEYEYDSFGNLTSVSEINSRTVKYTDGRTDIIDYKTKDVIYSSYTNDDGDFIEVIGGVTYTSKSYDSAYDIATGITTEKSDVTATNGKTIGTVDKQDWFGRYTESVVKTESANDTSTENSFASVKTEYTYPEYEDNKTSNRIEGYSNTVTYGTDTTDENRTDFYGFAYDYDNNGNIVAEYSVNAGGTETLRYGYVYDGLNQLVRTNDAVAQKTYTYTYDGAGNILTKTTYPYTTGELGTASETVNYTYDETWKDKLVSYGRESLTYDNIGNPLTIGSKQFNWSGRQLETYVDGTKTIEFEYDENGLRHRKTVKENGVITEKYDYVWSDGSLITQTYTTYSNGEVSTTNSAKFIYDAWGTIQGFILNNSETYLYVKNLQGDIIAIVDENGQTIVEYSYDAWGAVTFSATTMQNMMLAYTLSLVSPFTYRGYCYDYDIELYYLQSRYYSAEIGRFINTDDTQIAIATQGEILGVNLFAYCNNNPVMNVDYTGYISISTIIGAIIGFGAGAILLPIFADYKGYTGKKRSWFIGLGTAVLTIIGGLLGHYAGKAILTIYSKGKKFASILNKAIAKSIAKFTKVGFSTAAGNGYKLNFGKYVIRIMTGSTRSTNYIRIAHATKGSMLLTGKFCSDQALTHIPITISNIIKLIKLILDLKG